MLSFYSLLYVLYSQSLITSQYLTMPAMKRLLHIHKRNVNCLFSLALMAYSFAKTYEIVCSKVNQHHGISA